MLAVTSRVKQLASFPAPLSRQVQAIALSLLVALWPEDLHASTLGAIICNINHTANGYVHIISALAFIAGAYILVRGVMHLKKQAESPNEPSTAKAIAHFVVGGLLVSFPAALLMMQRTVFGTRSQAGTFACNASSPLTGASGLDVMIQSFVKNVHGPIFIMLSVISVITGITMIFRALLRGAKTGADPRASNPKDIVTMLFIGAVLISIGTILPDVLTTIFGSPTISKMSSFSGIQWSKIVGSANTQAADDTVKALLAFVQIIGGISFVRGWMLLKTAIEGGGQVTVPQGLTHIIGGAMAINIDVMLKVLDSTFGTAILK